MYRWLPAPLVLCGLALCLPGCGGGINYSGKVTFKGQPVPAGKIYFTPDGSKDNSGPTGYADIKNGAYDTAAAGGKAAVGGPTVVAIEAWDPAASAKAKAKDTSGEQLVQSLFPRYEVKEDLPRSSATKDFEVPAAAANRKDAPEQPAIVP